MESKVIEVLEIPIYTYKIKIDVNDARDLEEIVEKFFEKKSWRMKYAREEENSDIKFSGVTFPIIGTKFYCKLNNRDEESIELALSMSDDVALEFLDYFKKFNINVNDKYMELTQKLRNLQKTVYTNQTHIYSGLNS